MNKINMLVATLFKGLETLGNTFGRIWGFVPKPIRSVVGFIISIGAIVATIAFWHGQMLIWGDIVYTMLYLGIWISAVRLNRRAPKFGWLVLLAAIGLSAGVYLFSLSETGLNFKFLAIIGLIALHVIDRPGNDFTSPKEMLVLAGMVISDLWKAGAEMREEKRRLATIAAREQFEKDRAAALVAKALEASKPKPEPKPEPEPKPVKKATPEVPAKSVTPVPAKPVTPVPAKPVTPVPAKPVGEGGKPEAPAKPNGKAVTFPEILAVAKAAREKHQGELGNQLRNAKFNGIADAVMAATRKADGPKPPDPGKLETALKDMPADEQQKLLNTLRDLAK